MRNENQVFDYKLEEWTIRKKTAYIEDVTTQKSIKNHNNEKLVILTFIGYLSINAFY